MGYNDGTCTPYTDCSAHDAAAAALAAAEAALEVAKTNLENAQNLKDDLEIEKNTTEELMGDYKGVYNSLMNVGPAVANPSNMNALTADIKCLSDYGSNVENAYNQAVTEVSRCEAEVQRCETDVQNAQETLANTPCVQGCA
jgi:chromosome segregation ATPase